MTSTTIDFDELLDRSQAELKRKLAAQSRVVRKFGSWKLNQDERVLRLTSPDGSVAEAAAQLVGSFDTEHSTWFWAWGNRTIAEALTEHAAVVRDYGRTHGIPKLTEALFPSSESEGWQMTALAVKLNRAAGAFRGPNGKAWVFMTVGEFKVSKATKGKKPGAAAGHRGIDHREVIARVGDHVEREIRRWAETKYESDADRSAALAALTPASAGIKEALRHVQAEMGISPAEFAAFFLANREVMQREIAALVPRLEAVISEVASADAGAAQAILARSSTRPLERTRDPVAAPGKEIAAFVCEHVLQRNQPILLVSRAEGDWQFLCGARHSSAERPLLVGLNHLFDRDPTINELNDLRPDWEAQRSGLGKPWRRRKIAS